MRRRSGTTLVEALVACSILLIAIYAFCVLLGGSARVVGDTDRRMAAANLSRTQIEQINRIPYDKLPPESAVVPSEPEVQSNGVRACALKLGQREIIKDSVKVISGGRSLPGEDYSVDWDRGLLYLSPEVAGRRVSVNYCFRLSARTEVFRVPDSPPFRVRLLDCPEHGSIGVAREGVAVRLKSIDEAAGYLYFDEKDAGQSVVVTYRGAGFRSTVKSRYVGPDLSTEIGDDGGIKAIELEQSWTGAERDRRMELDFLKVR